MARNWRIGDQQLFEGTSAPIIELSATDSDGDSLTFSLSGADAALFVIDQDNALSPRQAFDFELPIDSGQDNTYSIVVAVSDGSATDEEAISITVRDALEGRVVDGPVGGASVVVVADSSDSISSAVLTDESGFWLIPAEFGDKGLRVRSSGGTDTVTGKDLTDLVLISEVPEAALGSINVNAITTVLATVETAVEKDTDITESRYKFLPGRTCWYRHLGRGECWGRGGSSCTED